MILMNGTILPSEKIGHILPGLPKQLCHTLQKPLLDPTAVIEACHKLAERFEQGFYNDIVQPLIAAGAVGYEQLDEIIRMFRRESLLYKMKLELGEVPEAAVLSPPFHENTVIRRERMPLGVLFHIAAGNVDGLPAYSVIEGLLAGNINLLKLPSADQGFTVMLLMELIRLEPSLADYIYVFDTPSSDLSSMKALAECADAIVVWGGDAAISSVRTLASPNTRIIEWGHKLSFAYITRQGISERKLTGLAHHILRTKQLLCSSCQGIFLDTGEMSVVYNFCEEFIRILNLASGSYQAPPMGIRAQINLLLYNQELSALAGEQRIYRGEHCSITASADKKLEPSYTYGNCWAKPLPHRYIISSLHRYKGYLQTVGLLCAPDEREALSRKLLRSGASRITDYDDMSRMLSGEAHDGEYPLQRYSRIAEY